MYGILNDATAEQLAANGHHLSAVYGTYARASPMSGENWETYALACLARSHYALQTILSIPSRHVDAAVLTRALFEHVVTFTWLLTDPEEHYRQLLAWEWNERKKLASDPHGFTMIEKPDEELASRALAGRGLKPAPSLAERADFADRCWGRLSEDPRRKSATCGVPWQWSLRHGYATLYRIFSVYAHPTVSGIDPFVVEARPPRIGLPRPIPQHQMVTVEAVKCFGDALAVSFCRFGWPPIEKIVAAFTNGLTNVHQLTRGG